VITTPLARKTAPNLRIVRAVTRRTTDQGAECANHFDRSHGDDQVEQPIWMSTTLTAQWSNLKRLQFEVAVVIDRSELPRSKIGELMDAVATRRDHQGRDRTKPSERHGAGCPFWRTVALIGWPTWPLSSHDRWSREAKPLTSQSDGLE